jgi:hypothetical protein
MISFVGSPLPDTVRAGPGIMRPVNPTASGSIPIRDIFGQRVRIDQLGDAARRLMPLHVQAVVLVPWSYGADCRPIPWGASARWLSENQTGLFRATLRAPEYWASGLPTFDILTTREQPYQEKANVPRQAPRLSTDALLRFYDMLPNNGEESDSVAALAFAKRVRADSTLRSSFPSRTFLSYARIDIDNARLHGVRVPVGGTYRVESTIAGERRVFFLRIASTVSSLQHGARDAGDTALVPREPEGYYVRAAAATTIAELVESCDSRVALRTGSVVAYVDLDWHGAGPTDTATEWKGGLDPRLLESVLGNEERLAWRQRQRDAAAARRPVSFVPQRPLRIWNDASGTLRIEGGMQIDQLGAVRFRGERLSLDALPCA